MGVTAFVALFTSYGVAQASWGGTGSGSTFSKARSMPTGNTPTTSITGRNVTVSWSTSSFAGGGPNISDYTVKRYNTGGALQSIGSNCSGTVSALTCTENNVNPGSWKYSVTPKSGTNWVGTESSQSTTQVVNAASYTLSSSSTLSSLPQTLNGNLAAFMTGQTITYRLDNPSTGTVLSATTTPTTIGTNGAASNSVTVPAGTSNGSHTIYAIGSSGDQASAAITVSAPVVTATVIDKSTGCVSGKIKQAGGYFVYANVTNSPASVSADVSNITTGQTNVALASGSWTVNGVSYNYRSAAQTASNPLSAGSKSYTVTPAGGSSSNGSVTADSTQPAASDIQATNKAGNIAGRPEAGDTITYTFSKPIDPCSLSSGWTGSGTVNTVVHINQSSTADPLVVFDSTDVTQLALGSVNTGNSVGVASRTFGLTGTASLMSMSGNTVSIVLGTASGTTNTQANTTLVWTPSTAAFDWSGNLNTATAATESGAADPDF
jgi:hypothetical protein